MPDLEAELKRTVQELRAVSAALDATETPALVRPDVPYKQVTEELVNWTIRVYAYSILSQFREILRSALHLYEADCVPAVFLCARAMWEMAAQSYYVKKHCLQYMDRKDWQATWKFMLGINQGSRHMKELRNKAAAVGPAGAAVAVVEELPEGPHIAKVMACFNEYFGSGSREATDNYSFLSEFCHPNSFAFTNHLEFGDSKARTSRVKVTFIRPGKDICIQVLPDMLYACMPVLFSMDELLRRVGDDGFGKAAREYGRITVPPEPTARK